MAEPPSESESGGSMDDPGNERDFAAEEARPPESTPETAPPGEPVPEGAAQITASPESTHATAHQANGPPPPENWKKSDDTLGELLQVAQAQAALEDDRSASQSLQAGWLIGFAGVILALAGGLGEKVLEDGAALGTFWRWFAAISLLLALLALLGAVVAALWTFAVRAPTGVFIDTETLNNFKSRDVFTRPRGEVRLARTTEIVQQIQQDRGAYKQRARGIKIGFRLLVLSIVFLLLHEIAFLDRATTDYPCSSVAATPSRVVQPALGSGNTTVNVFRLPALATQPSGASFGPSATDSKWPNEPRLLSQAAPPPPTPSPSTFCLGTITQPKP